MILIAVNLIYVVSGVIHYPLRSIDVYAIWLFKAKAFYLQSGLPLPILQNPRYLYSHPQYPLLLPLFFSKIYQLVGGVKEIYVLMLYPVIYLAILLLTYQVFRLVGLFPVPSLFFTYIYSMFSPLLAQAGRQHAGTADIILVLINWLAIYFLYKFNQNRPLLTGWLIVILVMIGSQIKLEGLFLISLLIFLSNSWSQRFKYISLAALPFLAWQITRFSLAIPTDFSFAFPGAVELINRLFIVFAGLIKEMLNLKNWYIFWPLFVLAALLKPASSPYIRRIILPSLLVMSGLFTAVYLFATVNTSAYVSSSIDRILLQLSPFIFIIFVDWIKRLIFTRIS